MIRERFTVAFCLLFVAAMPVLQAEDRTPIETATAKVQVKVILDGKPVGNGRIFLHGDTSTFVGTRLNDDGTGTVNQVFLGSYVVTVEGDGIPVKFSQLEASQLRAKVAAGKNEFVFELTTK